MCNCDIGRPEWCPDHWQWYPEQYICTECGKLQKYKRRDGTFWCFYCERAFPKEVD
jgi:hypothetical protein